jgi:hypothetical protein
MNFDFSNWDAERFENLPEFYTSKGIEEKEGVGVLMIS